MLPKLTRRNLFLLATTSVLGLGLAVSPVAFDLDLNSPTLKAAWADGGDGGEGGGDDGGESGDDDSRDAGESGESDSSDDDDEAEPHEDSSVGG